MSQKTMQDLLNIVTENDINQPLNESDYNYFQNKRQADAFCKSKNIATSNATPDGDNGTQGAGRYKVKKSTWQKDIKESHQSLNYPEQVAQDLIDSGFAATSEDNLIDAIYNKVKSNPQATGLMNDEDFLPDVISNYNYLLRQIQLGEDSTKEHPLKGQLVGENLEEEIAEAFSNFDVNESEQVTEDRSYWGEEMIEDMKDAYNSSDIANACHSIVAHYDYQSGDGEWGDECLEGLKLALAESEEPSFLQDSIEGLLSQYEDDDEDFDQDMISGYPGDNHSNDLDEDAPVVKYGVFSKGGSIGSGPDHLKKPIKTFDDPAEAKAYAARMRKQLSPGERKYYKMSYTARKLRAGELTETDDDFAPSYTAGDTVTIAPEWGGEGTVLAANPSHILIKMGNGKMRRFSPDEVSAADMGTNSDFDPMDGYADVDYDAEEGDPDELMFDSEDLGSKARRLGKKFKRGATKKMWWDGFVSPAEMKERIQGYDNETLLKLAGKGIDQQAAGNGSPRALQIKLINKELRLRGLRDFNKYMEEGRFASGKGYEIAPDQEGELGVDSWDDVDQDEEREFQDGDMVRLTGAYAENPDEVFTLSQWDGRRGWIGDDDGRGWRVSASQIEHAETEDEEYDRLYGGDDDYYGTNSNHNAASWQRRQRMGESFRPRKGRGPDYDNMGTMSKSNFKKAEMQHELGHEDEIQRQEDARRVKVSINGKYWKTMPRAQAAKAKRTIEAKGKKVTLAFESKKKVNETVKVGIPGYVSDRSYWNFKLWAKKNGGVQVDQNAAGDGEYWRVNTDAETAQDAINNTFRPIDRKDINIRPDEGMQEAIVKTEPGKYKDADGKEMHWTDDETGELFYDHPEPGPEEEPELHTFGDYDDIDLDDDEAAERRYQEFTKNQLPRGYGKKGRLSPEALGAFGDIAAGGGDPIDYLMSMMGYSMDQINAEARSQGYSDAHEWAAAYYAEYQVENSVNNDPEPGAEELTELKSINRFRKEFGGEDGLEAEIDPETNKVHVFSHNDWTPIFTGSMADFEEKFNLNDGLNEVETATDKLEKDRAGLAQQPEAPIPGAQTGVDPAMQAQTGQKNSKEELDMLKTQLADPSIKDTLQTIINPNDQPMGTDDQLQGNELEQIKNLLGLMK